MKCSRLDVKCQAAVSREYGTMYNHGFMKDRQINKQEHITKCTNRATHAYIGSDGVMIIYRCPVHYLSTSWKEITLNEAIVHEVIDT
jgi:hypothetical protein